MRYGTTEARSTHRNTENLSVKLGDLSDSVVKVRLRYFLVCKLEKLWHHFSIDPVQVCYKNKKNVMEDRELEKAATIVGMLLLITTFIMGILDTL